MFDPSHLHHYFYNFQSQVSSLFPTVVLYKKPFQYIVYNIHPVDEVSFPALLQLDKLHPSVGWFLGGSHFLGENRQFQIGEQN
jgi:hypothetical protein